MKQIFRILFYTMIVLISLLFWQADLSAQSFTGKLNPFPLQKSQLLENDTVKILAVMVNFQEDRDGATFGNGKFGSIYSQDYGNTILDPLPHNRDYFESHLTFVQNYYQKVSKGKTHLEFTILPDTFSVSQTMRNYSPTPGSDDLTPIGQFAQEVWLKVDQIYPTFNFSDYNVFLIFHAGVGRDISLPGSIGNERDLPSVYLSENALKNMFGSSFNGFPVSNGSFLITNSMIIPETESRELETITGKFLFEISINGLIVASVASHLGLPDLFDTETGFSAIGRFGLMDGQSIFAYNGCFPPEPSAWEKIYLGWAEPIEILPGNHLIQLSSNLSSTLADTVILKVPLNSTEYYLIENRIRDNTKDGSIINYKLGDVVYTKQFLKDTTGFYSYDTDSLAGVVIDVDEFDWALPGNGIVIWHIDEKVISEKLAENKINTDKYLRGVDVEEADGIQDIGERFITIFGDEVIGEGTDQDFWYAGNKAELFKNNFSIDSRPNTRTNTGANSLITIKDFSDISNKMTFKIEYGDSIIKPLFYSSGFDSIDGATITSIESEKILFAINTPNSLIISDGDSILQTVSDFSDFKPASVKFGNINYLIGVKVGNPAQQFPTSINFLLFDGALFSSSTTNITDIITSAPVVRKTVMESYEVLMGTNDGKILIFSLEMLHSGNPIPKPESPIVETETEILQVAVNNSKIFAIASKQNSSSKYDLIYNDGSIIKFNDERLLKLAATVDVSGNDLTIVSSNKLNDYYYYVTSADKIISTFKPNSNAPTNLFALADLKNDGNNYLIINEKNKITAYNFNGSTAENFPFELKDGDEFVGLPLAADIEGDLKSEIISFTKSGKVFAFDGGTGKIINGFPLTFGTQIIADPILFSANNKTGLAGLDNSNTFSGWSVSSTQSKIDWAEVYGNNLNSSAISKATESQKINSFFPSNRAYNYPNPVYDGQTAIRYFVNEDSKINIKIFDLAGDFVAELSDDAQGGMDNETIWIVSDVQSGVYLARIEAVGSSGQTESVIIKIAIVK